MRRAADLCTWLRIVLAPVLAATVAATGAPSALPLAVFAVAAASDFLDGRLARAAGPAVAASGRLFDHGADILLLIPTLGVLAHHGRVTAALPCAAALAFALYVADGWMRGGPAARIVLAPSRAGAAAGIANYAVTGTAAGALWLGPTALDAAVAVAALGAAALNLAAALERTRTLLVPVGVARRGCAAD